MREMQSPEVSESLSYDELEIRRKFLSEDQRIFGVALREIEEQYGPMIKNVWRKQGVTNPDLQDDLLQDLMIRLVEKRTQFRGESTLKTWIISIAKNLAPKALQSKMYRPWKQYVSMNDGNTLDGTVDDLEHCPFEVSEMLALLQKKLRQAYQDVVQMLIEGKSYKEMADSLGVPLGTIRSRVSHIHREIEALCKKIDTPRKTHPKTHPHHITSRVA